MYPIFLVLALAVSVWRAYLARTLNIHQLGAPAGRRGAGAGGGGASGLRG
jgi:hypothetical protein